MASAHRPGPERSPGAPTLVLVPTPLERARLEAVRPLPRGSGLVEVAGFGVAAAAARTARLLATLAPRRVLLVGVAGTYDPARLAVGEAAEPVAVRIDGIGAGEGAARIGPRALGFAQVALGAGADAPAVWERLAWNGERDAERGELVTACFCSASRREADARRERYPRALAEDMEGFGVALACALERVPLRIVRGASNVAGDRNARAWRIDDALAAASELARALLERDEPWLLPRPEDEA